MKSDMTAHIILHNTEAIATESKKCTQSKLQRKSINCMNYSYLELPEQRQMLQQVQQYKLNTSFSIVEKQSAIFLTGCFKLETKSATLAKQNIMTRILSDGRWQIFIKVIAPVLHPFGHSAFLFLCAVEFSLVGFALILSLLTEKKIPSLFFINNRLKILLEVILNNFTTCHFQPSFWNFSTLPLIQLYSLKIKATGQSVT